MSVIANDHSDLFTSWDDTNLTHHDSNMSHVEIQICLTSFSRSALLKTVCTFYIFFFLVGLVANVSVLWINLRSGQRERHEMHLYILNLAVADLCVVSTLPLWASSLAQEGHWPFGHAACKLTHLTFSVSLFASIFFLACMSVDRYLTVAQSGETSGQWKTPARRIVCAGMWLVALVASVPDTYFLQSVESLHNNVTLCHPVYPQNNPMEWMVGIELSFVVLGFAVPFPIIATSYTRLANALTSSNCDQGRNISRKTIVTYILVFLVCWVPYQAVLLTDALALLGVLSLSCKGENGIFVALNLTQCLSMLHCCLNPLLYTFSQRRYRYDFMKAFIFKYSTRTGLAQLMEGSQGAEIEYTTLENQLQL
ncbi:atypical chemokine receptor 3 [Astyanax mexicanus]|uniref:atypical chemokine receptor 3 n=1 Tax=Astyanax mexicanus TaxID=7994 RepID=UPI0020CAB82C|nr:atypical chemokine receptor 3 [Astyanax mexicanus]